MDARPVLFRGQVRAILRAAIHAIGDAAPGWATATAVLHMAPADAADQLLTSA